MFSPDKLYGYLLVCQPVKPVEISRNEGNWVTIWLEEILLGKYHLANSICFNSMGMAADNETHSRPA